MRKFTRLLLVAFVFTVPWDVVAVEGFGALSRLMGVATLGVGFLTLAMEGRFRKPNAILVLATAFTVSSALTLLWSISYPDTVVRVWTYAQLLGSAWVIHEFARTRKEQHALLLAYCLGAFVPVGGVFNSFHSGVQVPGT